MDKRILFSVATHYTTNTSVITCIEARTFLSIKRQNDALQNAFPNQVRNIFSFFMGFTTGHCVFLSVMTFHPAEKKRGIWRTDPFSFFFSCQEKRFRRKLNSKSNMTSLLGYHSFASHPSDLSR